MLIDETGSNWFQTGLNRLNDQRVFAGRFSLGLREQTQFNRYCKTAIHYMIKPAIYTRQTR